ncbi:hypothetical protein [Nonomuraea sp. NPDC049684]|uniref:hypothetical protein n=1 Tax=Nonomuraea sp. NPDC049684 TaxID=3364356 RepID=UPI0037B53188
MTDLGEVSIAYTVRISAVKASCWTRTTSLTNTIHRCAGHRLLYLRRTVRAAREERVVFLPGRQKEVTRMSEPAGGRAAAGLLILLTLSADAIYATLPPGRMRATALPAGYWEHSRGDRFTATSDSGRQYLYQGRVCNGNVWKLPSPGG